VDEFRDYQPVQPRGFDWRRLVRQIWAPIAFVLGIAIKFGFVIFKFFGIFISVAAYALIWGWKFGVGFVLLILVHELGHFFEAKRQGVEVSLPRFIPFIGAYVTIKNAGLTPWRSALIAAAGPFAGGIGAGACWVAAAQQNSRFLYALAYVGFLLNLFNLIPLGIFDGGAIARAASAAWSTPQVVFEGGVPMRLGAPNRARAMLIAAIYVGLVAILVYGMWKTHVSQTRL
jgi:Zn-dependent protease